MKFSYFVGKCFRDICCKKCCYKQMPCYWKWKNKMVFFFQIWMDLNFIKKCKTQYVKVGILVIRTNMVGNFEIILVYILCICSNCMWLLFVFVFPVIIFNSWEPRKIAKVILNFVVIVKFCEHWYIVSYFWSFIYFQMWKSL